MDVETKPRKAGEVPVSRGLWAEYKGVVGTACLRGTRGFTKRSLSSRRHMLDVLTVWHTPGHLSGPAMGVDLHL